MAQTRFCWTGGRQASTIMNLHMLFDLVGKLVPSIKHFKLKLAPGLVMCYCRVLFCVLFVLITLPRNRPVIRSDAASFVIEIAFSLSQSLLYTSCIMQYQDNFTNRRMQTYVIY
ncbi:Equilibrative_nucleoside transporter family protein [Hexamita inflata]|uniref:Equilibrative_nucleoside transporter family protein n=1 Tax=Hexamita inflata TaxID=28002 RepID=A0ABP1ISZ0_9EUKA